MISEAANEGTLRNFAKFTGKHLCQSLFFNKKETLAQVLSCEFCQIFNNTCFIYTYSIYILYIFYIYYIYYIYYIHMLLKEKQNNHAIKSKE